MIMLGRLACKSDFQTIQMSPTNPNAPNLMPAFRWSGEAAQRTSRWSLKQEIRVSINLVKGQPSTRLTLIWRYSRWLDGLVILRSIGKEWIDRIWYKVEEMRAKFIRSPTLESSLLDSFTADMSYTVSSRVWLGMITYLLPPFHEINH